jgi:hypothetical protein
MKSLDKIIIVDPFEDRANSTAQLLANHAHDTVVMTYGVDDPRDEDCVEESSSLSFEVEDLKQEFAELISACLENRERVMVIFSIHSGVKLDLLKTLLELEEVYDLGTRRILLTCRSSYQVNQGFKRRGLPRGKVKHILYDSVDETHLEKLEELFYSAPSSTFSSVKSDELVAS